MNLLKLRSVAFVSILLTAAGVSAATLPAPVDAAITDVETRRTAAGEELRFTFKMHTVTAESEFQFRFDPQSSDGWTLVSEETKQTAKMRERMIKRAIEQEHGPDRELLVSDLRELIGDKIELVENDDRQRVYRFDLSEEAAIGGDGGSFDASKHLTGELAIGPGDRLLWLRFFAPKAFKPAVVAKIKSFNLKMFYDPIWPDGPYVLVRQSMNLDGSAFFKSFKEDVETQYTEFEKR